MRIVLDFQTCQSASRYRGIGRGSRSLMLAMARLFLSRGHEVICLLNNAFAEGLDELKGDITAQIPKAKLAFFQIPTSCAAAWPENAWRQMAGRLLREHAIACLEPDFVHIPALLADGWGDDSVASVGLLGMHIPVSLTQHDLIPLVMSESYMSSSRFRDYYKIKLENVKQADLLLAISKYAQLEAIEWLSLIPENVIHISSAVDEFFREPVRDSLASEKTLRKLGVREGFFLYAPGGFDYRKNIDRLFVAYALLPAEVRAAHQLVIASRLDPVMKEIITQSIEKKGLKQNEVLLTDYVTDESLKHLYSSCFTYVFPSLHEGFGLPALEAMASGAPVIASNCTSIPEVVGLDEALFDPYDPHSIAARMLQVHKDGDYRARLRSHSKTRPNQFSWDKSGEIAVDAITDRHRKLVAAGWQVIPRSELPDCKSLIEHLRVLVPSTLPTQQDLAVFRACYDYNWRRCG